ncbi:MAG: hypothetical protein LBV74_01235 [Tannerella sp.]|jgi:hypothetical protein|nr:hypothetical protein [Tannerella sp.]
MKLCDLKYYTRYEFYRNPNDRLCGFPPDDYVIFIGDKIAGPLYLFDFLDGGYEDYMSIQDIDKMIFEL